MLLILLEKKKGRSAFFSDIERDSWVVLKVRQNELIELYRVVLITYNWILNK